MSATADKKEVKEREEPGKQLADDKAGTDVLESFAANSLYPAAKQLGFSGAVGLVSGFAVKEIGKRIVVIVGAGVLVIQGLAYAGFVDVHWNKVESAVKSSLDVNNDGKVDEEDVRAITRKIMKFLKFGMTSTAGFSLGFLAAMRYA